MDFNLWVMSPTPLNYPMKENEKNIFPKQTTKGEITHLGVGYGSDITISVPGNPNSNPTRI